MLDREGVHPLVVVHYKRDRRGELIGRVVVVHGVNEIEEVRVVVVEAFERFLAPRPAVAPLILFATGQVLLHLTVGVKLLVDLGTVVKLEPVVDLE